MSDNIECVLPIEELSALKKVGRVGSSSDDDQSTVIGDISHDEDELDERIRELKDLVEVENQQTTTLAQDQGNRPPPKIQKVPFVLGDRKKFEKYYEPRVVSVGPIHHGKPNLRVAERYKLKLAAAFIKQSGKETRALYKMISNKIDQLKDYYHEDEHKKYDDKTLSRILFLDGCAVLQFIHDFYHGKLNEFMIKTDHIAFTQHDLFLLENQIPFEVLRLLMDLSEFRSKLKKSMGSFIRRNIMAPLDYTEKLSIDMDNLDFIPIHLLDLLQHVSVLNNNNNNNNNKNKKKEQIGSRSVAEIDQQQQQQQQQQKKKKKKKKKKEQDGSGDNLSFRNVQELKAAGIDLKLSKTCSLADITFNSSFFTGWLNLPPMIVDDSTKPKFLNLIAYESCPDNFRTNYEVTSYISFLDSLIDHANDVKELRRPKILRNLLGSDEEVASLFNEIATDLVPNLELYKDVKSKIQKHYDNKWRTWMAEAYHDHFSSPWTILAFIAALVGLTLSGIQTWYGVFSPSHP
ncbi:hypothetical protein TIFTF001_024614 [Ficus carica]|uniref:Uncharacterized protein n=1 Tax=Ficus carica TaxID=3494 RepID=A0AA88AMD2_FICCA|nr:hypothetical protein TIFTF001_024614 [Ficus carica]